MNKKFRKKIRNISLDGVLVGPQSDPYIVAEMSGNHNGSLEDALKIIRSAKECGADAVKIQTYTPDTITINHDSKEFIKQDGLWKGRRLYELYEEAHTPWEWHYKLFEYAKEIGITLFSSPFDESAVDFLEELGNPIYKIASPEIIDLPLIQKVASTKKPLIFSTGMATKNEIEEAVNTAYENGCKDLIVLHCTSSYPAPINEANLVTISQISYDFGVISGLSDHTIGTIAASTAIALGACLIEKHFILNKKNGGVDSYFSIEPKDLKKLVRDCKMTKESLGKTAFRPTESEKNVLKNRRSLYVVKDIKQGEILSKNNIKSIRPGNGLLPKFFNDVLGRKAIRDLSFGEPLQNDMFC